jgi:RND family efflux transporter MFP subunit
MKGWRIVAILLLCLVLAGSGACGGEQQEAERQLIEVVRGDLMVSISGSGNIGVSREASLAFGSGGRVDKIYVEDGDEVSKGDVLAKLDTGDLELALAQAKVALEQAEYNLNQLKDVLHASQDRIKIAESELEVAELAVARAQKQLDEATITAPFDGVVAAVYVKEGDITPSPTMAPKIIIYLITPNHMELSAEVDEIDIAEVKLGQSAVISLDALPDKQLEGVVTLVSSVPIIEAGLVLYKVKIGFDVPQGLDLKVGMSATADIIVQQRENALLVPERAIERDSQGKPMVWVKINEQIEERPVVTGISDGLQTEILDGLKEGEIVVVEKRAKPKPSGMGCALPE